MNSREVSSPPPGSGSGRGSSSSMAGLWRSGRRRRYPARHTRGGRVRPSAASVSWRSTPSSLAVCVDSRCPMDSLIQTRPIVVHPHEPATVPAVPAMEVRHQLDRDGRGVGWTGRITNDASHVSGWHHHAANDTYVYVIEGSVTIEFGPGGAERIEARAGDFFIVPAQAIHREITGSDGDLDAFLLRLG